MQELHIVPQVLATLLEQPGTIALIAMLLTAAVIDVRSHRIPNWLTGGGIVVALVFAAVGVAPQQEGFLSSLGGMAAGLAMLLPMYLLRVMGAGDVKLMAMVGAFVGLSHIVPAVLFSVIAGGIAAIAFSLYNRAFGRMATNIIDIVQSMAFATMVGQQPTPALTGRASVGKLPYGVSIAAGTIVWLAARLLGLA
jgi:prepilin peptidase CpaA